MSDRMNYVRLIGDIYKITYLCIDLWGHGKDRTITGEICNVKTVNFQEEDEYHILDVKNCETGEFEEVPVENMSLRLTVLDISKRKWNGLCK